MRLSDLRGRPTIINFWATWCGSCVAELPDLKTVQQEIGPANLNVIAVDAGEDAASARRFLKVLDAPAFHIGLDPTLVIADAYGVFGLPNSFFIDANGVVRAIYTGQVTKELMRQYMRAATTATDGPAAPPRIRLITSVARDHVPEVKPLAPGRVEFWSKSLRCDETVLRGRRTRGIRDGWRRHVHRAPPRRGPAAYRRGLRPGGRNRGRPDTPPHRPARRSPGPALRAAASGGTEVRP